MDFKTIREQILSNLDNFDNEEKRVIILKLLDFVKQLDAENHTLKQENQQLTQEIDELSSKQMSQDEYKAKVEEIIDLANKEADKIIESAHEEVEQKMVQADEQSKEYIYDLLVRMENIVKELREIDDEAKAYRLHIMTIFKKTIFKFSDSDYHILKINDDDLKNLMKFYKEDDALQLFSEQIMHKLANFEKYLGLCETKIKDNEYDEISIKKLEDILSNNFVLESSSDDQTEEELSQDEIDEESEHVSTQEKMVESEPKTEDVEEDLPPASEEKKTIPQNTKFLDIFNKYNS